MYTNVAYFTILGKNVSCEKTHLSIKCATVISVV